VLSSSSLLFSLLPIVNYQNDCFVLLITTVTNWDGRLSLAGTVVYTMEFNEYRLVSSRLVLSAASRFEYYTTVRVVERFPKTKIVFSFGALRTVLVPTKAMSSSSGSSSKNRPSLLARSIDRSIHKQENKQQCYSQSSEKKIPVCSNDH